MSQVETVRKIHFAQFMRRLCILLICFVLFGYYNCRHTRNMFNMQRQIPSVTSVGQSKHLSSNLLASSSSCSCSDCATDDNHTILFFQWHGHYRHVKCVFQSSSEVKALFSDINVVANKQMKEVSHVCICVFLFHTINWSHYICIQICFGELYMQSIYFYIIQ